MKLCFQACLPLVLVGLAPGPARGALAPSFIVSTQLRQLAAHAARRSGWPRLRHYAAARRDPRERGMAYFVLGYREYQAGEYQAGAKDLHEAAAGRFPAADLAAYYEGAAAHEGGDALGAVAALDSFSSRFPSSWVHLQATELLAQSLLDAHEPARALDVLLAEVRVRQRPTLTLLLAKAYLALERFPEAARAFQEVAYAFPTTAQAREASQALEPLWSRLGPEFPLPSDEMETARTRAFYKAGQYDEALRHYEELARVRATSALVDQWQLGQARCLIRLRRWPEAAELLATPFPHDPLLDAERLALRVGAFSHLDDAPNMLQTLGAIQSQYPLSSACAEALSTAAGYFFRKGNWAEAVQYDHLLTETFPQDEHLPAALWRLGLCQYLLKEKEKAEQSWKEYVTRYPDAPREAAALYWLGRLAEGRAAPGEARALYALVRRRFAHSYYAVQAGHRLQSLGSAPETGAAAPEPLGALAAQIAPRPAPPASLCGPSPGEGWQRVRMLQALGLESLAEDLLRIVLSEGAPEPDLRQALAELESAQGDGSAALLEAVRVEPKYADYDFSELPGPVWNLLYPRSYWTLVRRQAQARGLDPYLAMGVIRQESAFNPRATSRADARGLMQVLPRTAARSRRQARVRAAGRRLYNPAYNIRLGCAYLQGLIKAYNGSLEEALAAYNAGEARVKGWLARATYEDSTEFLEAVPFGETRAYVESVLRDAAIYRLLIAGKPQFKKCG